MTRTPRFLSLFIAACAMLFAAAAARAQNGNPPGPGGALWAPFAPGCKTHAADIPGLRMAFSWSGPGYQKVDVLQPGYGYFLIPENPAVDLALPDCRMHADKMSEVSVTLSAGWNLLGNPFTEAIEFQATADASGARAQAFTARAAARAARDIISQGGLAAPGGVVWVYSAIQGKQSLDKLAKTGARGILEIVPVRAARDKRQVFFVNEAVAFTLKATYDDGRTVYPANAMAQWRVSDENLARFESAGALKTLAPGQVTITAQLDDGLRASLDIMAVIECEALCVSAAVRPGEYDSVQAYEQFADAARTLEVGVAPVPLSSCAYMETSRRYDPKPVQTAALSVVESSADSNAGLRAYCKFTYQDSRAMHVFNEKDPATGQFRTVYLKDVTGLAKWAWNNADAIKGISESGVIQTGKQGRASVTAEYMGAKSSPAFVTVQGDAPVSIVIDKIKNPYAKNQYNYTYNYATDYNNSYTGFSGSNVIPPWKRLPCRTLPQGICASSEKPDKYIEILQPGDTAYLSARVEYKSGRVVNNPQGIAWSAAAPGVAEVSADGHVTGMAQGRTQVFASLGSVRSAPLDVPVVQEKTARLTIAPWIKTGHWQWANQTQSLRPPANNDTVRVHDPELLSFTVSAETNLGRRISLSSNDVAWEVTDAVGGTVSSPVFKGAGPFHVTVTYQNHSLSFMVEKENLVPEIKAYTAQKEIELTKQADGVIYAGQPDLLVFVLEAGSASGYTADFSSRAQWSVKGPDGRETSGTPSLRDKGVYTVSAAYNGRTSSVVVEVYEAPAQLRISKDSSSWNTDADRKYKSGETFKIIVEECSIQDYEARGAKIVDPPGAYTGNASCTSYRTSQIDSRYQIQITSPGVLQYKGNGQVMAGQAGKGGVRAVRGGFESKPLEVEVWEPSDDFPICGADANQSVWYDPRRAWTSASSGDPESRAIIQTDCDRYERGHIVKVRWFGQIAPGVPRNRVNVCLDLYIKDCSGRVVKTFRREGCERFAGRAASDFSGYTTVFDTVEEWDMTNDKGQPVAPGCYMASSTFNILYEPVVEVKFTVE